MSHLADHITIVLLCGEYAGSFNKTTQNPRGTFEETNLHFTSELRELVARQVEKIIPALVGIP